MKAVVRRGTSLVLDEVGDPAPGPGQVLVKTLACGICGSDLHALHHADQMADLSRRTEGSFSFDPAKDIIFGHEFCAEIIDYGLETPRNLSVGSMVCSVPVCFGADGPETVGYSNTFPGGFAEHMVLQADALLEVPNGLSADYAALTEPMAVGAHAVAKAAMTKDDVALVLGCGPVGLAVIAALKAQGFGPVIAADFSEGRRRFAERMGADILVDPARKSPYGSWDELNVPSTRANRMIAEMSGQESKSAVIFECVGVPGVINQIMEGAPLGARVVVVGVCMEMDRMEPMLAINKELEFKFVLGYNGEEFAQTLHQIADGTIDVEPIITAQVGLGGVAQAFEDLSMPDLHAKILVKPGQV